MKRASIAAVGASIFAGSIVVLGGGLAHTATIDGPDITEMNVGITGPALEKASAAALSFRGERKVTETTVGDESHYEVDVTLDNGSEVGVQLDESSVSSGEHHRGQVVLWTCRPRDASRKVLLIDEEEKITAEGQFARIVRNVLDNAIQHGGEHITVSLREDDTGAP